MKVLRLPRPLRRACLPRPLGRPRRRGGTASPRPAVAVGLVLAGLGLSAPAVVGGRADAAVPAPVRQTWVQGDSVMAGAADTVRNALQADGWRAVVTGWPGLHLWAAIGLFSQVRPQMGSVAVVELGDNDCCDGARFGSQIDQAMAVLSGLHVIWLTGSELRPGQASTNAAIRAAAGRWPNLEVADWAAVVAQHPDAVFRDGVHLSVEGKALMAAFVRGRVDAWYSRFAGPAFPVGRAYGPAAELGPDGTRLSSGAVVGGAPTPTGSGYWLAATDGGVFTFGDAGFFGSAGAITLRAPVVGMAATPDGRGYWLVGADGGVFSFGHAPFLGSAVALRPRHPIVGIVATPDGRGYWLVGSDGGVFSFGDARFSGSAGATPLAAPVVGMAATPDGRGYWMVGSDGGVLSFGDAAFNGSLGGTPLAAPVESMAATPDGAGYWLLDADGQVYGFGDALSNASASASAAAVSGRRAGPFYATASPAWSTAIVPRPGGGYWVAGQAPAG